MLTDADVLGGARQAEPQGPSTPPREALPDDGFFIARRAPVAAGPGDAATLAARLLPSLPAPDLVAAVPPPDPLDAFFYREDEPAAPVLDLGLSAPAAPSRPAASDAIREYLGFFLAEEEYAVEIDRVREILKAPPITEVPRAPEFVAGVVSVRGEVVPVVDPRLRIGLPPPTGGRPTRLVICDVGEGPVALLVDRVSDVVRLPASAVEARPEGIGLDPETLAGIGRDGDRMLILLDAEALVGRGAAAEAPG